MQDPNDSEASKQSPLARKVLTESASLFVAKTVVLELEWVLRAFYGHDSSAFARVMQHFDGFAQREGGGLGANPHAT